MKTVGLTILYLCFGCLMIRVADARAPHIGKPIVSLAETAWLI